MKRETVTTTLRWLGDWPWYTGLTAALILALAAWLLYRREVGAMRPVYRVLLPVLRALAVFLIVVLLGGPVLHHRKVIGDLARLIVLLDGSESMQLADPGMDAGRKIQILERLGMLDPGAVNLDQPQASAALAEAKNLADGIKVIDAPGAEVAKKLGIKVYTIGVGTTGTAPFRTRDIFGRETIGQAEVRIDEAQLKRIADLTGASYYNVRSPDGLKEALDQISQLETTRVRREIYLHHDEHFLPWFAAGLTFFLLGITLNMLLLRRIA